MPCYLVERTFISVDQFNIPGLDDPHEVNQRFVENNTRAGVTWLYSYVTPAKRKVFCLYEGSSPEAVRLAANLNRLPVDRISEIRRLHPFSDERASDEWVGES